MKTLAPLALVAAVAVATTVDAATPPAPKPPTGRWHAALVPLPDVEVAFGLRVEMRKGALRAFLVNGAFEAPFTSAAWDGATLVLELAHFDGRLEAREEAGGLSGRYVRTTAAGRVEVPFRASRTPPPAPPAPKAGDTLGGEWAVEIEAGKEPEKTLGVFSQKGSAVAGSLLSTTGDYGPLHGTFDGKTLVLSVFDGVHVYRFDAERGADGSLTGSFRSRVSPPRTFHARRLAAGEADRYLPEGFARVRAKDPAAPFTFSFPDESGAEVSSTDARFAGKPILVTLMGTWCPNCNDEAPVVKELHGRYAAKGLAVVSLAFEYTDDVERNRRQVRRFKERYGIPWPVLVAGTTKSAPASPVMAQLEGWQGYPTTLFLDRSHRIVKVHSGFDGPATGARHAALRKELEAAVRALLE